MLTTQNSIFNISRSTTEELSSVSDTEDYVPDKYFEKLKNLNEGQQTETLTLTRKGNIGVMTGSDLIKKHIDLQKELNNVINMFFEKECNDLFMKIY